MESKGPRGTDVVAVDPFAPTTGAAEAARKRSILRAAGMTVDGSTADKGLATLLARYEVELQRFIARLPTGATEPPELVDYGQGIRVEHTRTVTLRCPLANDLLPALEAASVRQLTLVLKGRFVRIVEHARANDVATFGVVASHR